MTYNQPAWMEKLPQALDVIANDDAINILFLQCGAMGRHAEELSAIIRDLRDRTRKTVCLAWPLGPAGSAERARADGFHVFTEYARAVNAIGKAVRYRRDIDTTIHPAAADEPRLDWNAAVGRVMPGTVISEHECHRILRLAGLPVAAGELASSVDAAEAAARRIGFPLAMKGISPLVTHRARLGLVVLDVRSGVEARSVYCRLSERAATAGIALEGVYLQRMAAPGVEALVSAFRDPTFGVMISCAFGGGMTELIDDVALARAPLDEAGSRDLLRGLRLMRAAGDIPVAPLAGFVAALSQLAASAPWRSFTLEINPVLWNAEGAVAVDGLLIVEQP
jgi:acyl-CoA synthetase (NDP forming)